MELIISSDLHNYFDKIINIYCSEFTKTYIIDILSSKTKFNKAIPSYTLAYKDALDTYDFKKIQEIGDRILFAKSIFPESLKGASIEYYNSIASSAYYKCHIMLNKEWIIFEELSDQFTVYTLQIQESLRQSPDFKSRF
jgi:hypothetical protein